MYLALLYNSNSLFPLLLFLSFLVLSSFAAINITRARFSGNDEFGWTSFVAYTAVPSLSLSYEFQLKLTLANDASALRDNLILFSGQKGQGENKSRHLAERGVKMTPRIIWKDERAAAARRFRKKVSRACGLILRLHYRCSKEKNPFATLRYFCPLCMVMCQPIDQGASPEHFQLPRPPKREIWLSPWEKPKGLQK